MLRRRFLIKADRMFKKPKPGRKRLVKWPKKLLPAENPLVTLAMSFHHLIRLVCRFLGICSHHTDSTFLGQHDVSTLGNSTLQEVLHPFPLVPLYALR